MKKINEIQKGDKIVSFYKISNFNIKVGKRGEYIDLEFSDNTGKISAKKWDYRKEQDIYKVGDIVKVEVEASEYMGNVQLTVLKIRNIIDEDNVDISEFLSVSKRDFEEMKSEFWNFVGSVKNEYLNKLLNDIFTEKTFERYSTVPAGISWHHAYIHGLLEHTLEISKICDLMSTFHKEINRDLLITAALLHDFGKTEEMQGETDFTYADKGKLIGHIVLASIFVSKKIEEIPDFPKELENQLIHLILSHQGKLEFASPVVPKTLEAITLYHADELSAKSNAYKNAINSAKKNESNWTQFIRLAETDLYKKQWS